MRPLEIIICLLLFVSILGHYVAQQKRPSWADYLPGIAIILVLIHLLAEGYRWQMVPAYFVALLLFLFSLGSFRGRRAIKAGWRRVFTIVAASVGLLLLVIATAISSLMPVFTLPQPTGPYAVGATRFWLGDKDHEESLTPAPDDTRELPVQVWYPADLPGDAERLPYWEDAAAFGRILTADLGLPSFLFDHVSLVKTNAYIDAPLAGEEATYPVLIFSHGYHLGYPAQNTTQMEELASQGYILFSIGHPYEMLAYRSPDGALHPFDEERVKALYAENAANAEVFERARTAPSREEREAAVSQFLRQTPVARESLGIWTADTKFVLDELERLNATDDRFAGRLDLSRLGIFGMSFGGTTAGQLCLVDRRCQAGINLDGLQHGDLFEGALERPFLFMESEQNAGINRFAYERVSGPAYLATAAGSTHFNYTDFNLFSPLFRQMGFLGSIDGRRMNGIMNAYILGFFDQYLQGKPSPLMNEASPNYPEVTIESRND